MIDHSPFNDGSREIRATLAAGLAAAALALSLGAPAAIAANTEASDSHQAHHARLLHPRHHRVRDAQTRVLPNLPEYGFLSHVPADAIRMPGYTFVPGVGILGASCDLPTSACSNQYRDIQ